jgi:hypothetical protein
MCKLNAHIAVALDSVRHLNQVGGAEAQQCLRTMRAALLAAEVDAEAIRALVDAVLDRMATGPMRGAEFAAAVRGILGEIDGIRSHLGEAAVRVPRFEAGAFRGEWDLKELSNRTPLRPAASAWVAPVMERRMPRHLPAARPKRLQAPAQPGQPDARAADLCGEKMNRMLRALGHGDTPEPPDMGQPALLV